MTNEPVIRYCPKCGARVKAPSTAFLLARKCPKCQESVIFHDYPRTPPTAVPTPPAQGNTDWFDYALYGSVAAFPVFMLISIICLLLGIGDLALFAAGVCLVLALPTVSRYVQLKGSLRVTAQERDALRLANDRLAAQLAWANELASGFKLNFDCLVADEKAELRTYLDEQMKNVDRKLRHAEAMLAAAQDRQSTIDALGKRFLSDTVSNISSRLTPNNYHASLERLQKVIAFCQRSGFDVGLKEARQLEADLRDQFVEVLKRQEAKEEQARIKARIREEQRAEREMQRELQRVANEKAAIERALAAALKQTHDEHSAEVERLRAMLAEAEAKAERTLSMAQQTKAGHIYVISNIGSFGENVFKVGMTRRLEPLDRIKELGDASVPFPFDVHMMISCDDAPALESALHRGLHRKRINRVNLRKEFFNATLDEIREIVEQNHGEVSYQATPEALEYHESITMSDEEFDFLSRQFASLPPEDDEAEELEECIEAAVEQLAP